MTEPATALTQYSWDDDAIRAEFSRIPAASPFVYGLTNYIAANLSANVLLAIGAGPAIGAAMDWPSVFPAGASGVWLNAAALMSSGPDSFVTAARTAHEAGTPWVLDPVAVGGGAAQYDAVIRGVLDFRPTVIRGNASELIALGGGALTGKGVESTADSADAVEAIGEIARATGAIVAVSGPTDFISDGEQTVAVPGGDVRLTKVTGAGCSLGALCASAVSSSDDPFLATVAAHAAYARAAERAGARTTGTGAFAVALVDELSLLIDS